MTDQAFDGHRFEPLSSLEDMQALRLGIQLHRQRLASELAGNGIRLQVNPDRAMGIDFAFHMPAIQPLQPAIRVNKSLAADARRARWEKRCAEAGCHS